MQSVADTLIISDLHLGSEVSRASEAVEMLRGIVFRRLILLGDIFCDLNFRRLTKSHWQFLSYIRKLSNPKRQVEVVWVEGNHDRGLSEVMSHLVGIPVYQQYEWTFANKCFLAIHGHQFDRFVVNNAVLSRAGEWVYLQMQRFDSYGKWLSHFMDRQNSKWLRLSPKVAKGAIALARSRSADVVFCGHTHQALHRECEAIEYFNVGCWTTAQVPTYAVVDVDGVRLCRFDSAVSQDRSLDSSPIDEDIAVA